VNIHGELRLPQLAEDLERFESVLLSSVEIGDEYLDSITTHLINAGGKRIRPVLSTAAATAGQRPATTDELLGGVALELMHLASLYHDDVMDEADIRRNVSSVNARFGNMVAIVAGDYLMARSAAIAADLGVEIASLLAHTLAWLTRGQVSEVRTAFQTSRSEADYYEAIEGKTASLMASSARVGALVAKRSAAEADALTTYGRCFGMIFQLRDDILDMTAVDGQLGKPAGQDLAEGIYTLPAIRAMADPVVGDEVRALLGRPLSDDERETARQAVVATDGLAYTMAAAQAFYAEANEALGQLTEPDLREGLSRLMNALLEDLPLVEPRL
jgi:heptaprenyl diphosphate synthase